MAIHLRNYTKHAGITEDYARIRTFLIKLGYSEFSYARWDWMITHSYLDKSAIDRIGIWEDDGEIIAAALFDCQLGTAFCMTYPEYAFLKKEMLLYSREYLSKEGELSVVIADHDKTFQNIAAGLNYGATQEKENDAVFHLDKTSTAYQLPEGFKITSLKETFDLYQYGRVLWKGFNHEQNGEGEFQFTKEKEQMGKEEMLRPNVDLSLKVAIVAPNGNFVSYCGMWYEPEAGFAVIEPVATDPDYRRIGLGKAVVLEGLQRVGKLGAKAAFVGSSQQFYYNIGLRPYATSTIWKQKKA